MSDLDAFLTKGSPAVVEQPKEPVSAPEAKAETPAPESAEAKAERERDEKGRFAKKAEAPTPEKSETPKAVEAPKVEKPAAPTAAEKPKTDADPAEPLDPKARAYYTKAKDEQRKRQAVEQELQQLRAQLQQQQPVQQQVNPPGAAQAQQGPDPLLDLVLNTSEIAARDKYGDDAVDEAQMWFKDQMAANPGLFVSLRQQRHPYKWVIQQFRQSRLLEEVGDDPDGYREKLKSQYRAEWEAEYAQRAVPQVPARPAPPAPPPSLASAPSTGNQQKPPEWKGPMPLQSIFKGK